MVFGGGNAYSMNFTYIIWSKAKSIALCASHISIEQDVVGITYSSIGPYFLFIFIYWLLILFFFGSYLLLTYFKNNKKDFIRSPFDFYLLLVFRKIP